MALVLNRISNDEAYRQSYPVMKGIGYPAVHELHVFLAEINPDETRVQNYYKTVEEWNRQHAHLTDKMKACFLALVFRGADGTEKTVKVMQSARYFRSDDSDEAVRQIHQDADFFVQRGFTVIREKIEASAYGISGIPQTDEETKLFDTKYFEFHIKVGKDCLNEKEIVLLREISRQFTKRFQIPVPLSYNCNQDALAGDGLGHQRFLNVRFRHKGLGSINPLLKEINQAITSTGLKVIKTISEYVWYDSFSALDIGWID